MTCAEKVVANEFGFVILKLPERVSPGTTLLALTGNPVPGLNQSFDEFALLLAALAGFALINVVEQINAATITKRFERRRVVRIRK